MPLGIAPPSPQASDSVIVGRILGGRRGSPRLGSDLGLGQTLELPRLAPAAIPVCTSISYRHEPQREVAAIERLGIKVIERNFPRYELYSADEVFLTGTGAEVIAAVKIDGRIIGKGVCGPTTKNLIKHFRDYANSSGTPIYQAVKAK